MTDGFSTHTDDEALWLTYNQDMYTVAVSLDKDASNEEINKAYHELLDMYLEAIAVFH